MSEAPLVVAPRKAAELLGIGQVSVFKLLKDGSLQSVKIGKSRRISVESIKRLAAEGTAR
jgi:excisionase family DNA binding protein